MSITYHGYNTHQLKHTVNIITPTIVKPVLILAKNVENFAKVIYDDLSLITSYLEIAILIIY